MKSISLAAFALLLVACAGQDLDSEFQTFSGVVRSVEVIDVEEVEGRTGMRSSIFFGFGSGGQRSIGIGLQSPLGQEEPRELVRYEVEQAEQGALVIHHPRRQYDIDDCLRVRVHPDAERYPPKIEGRADDCEG